MANAHSKLSGEKLEQRRFLSAVSFVSHVISADVNDAQSVQAADIDGDGDVDVLSASRNVLAWYDNTDGKGSFGQQNFIATFAIPGTSVYAADVDGDGDVDVLSAGHGELAWYENTDGKGRFGQPQVISSGNSVYVYAADVDGDGDVDVLLTNRGRLAWYEQLPQAAAGDANQDGQFDQQDILQVLQAAKYLAGEPVTFEQGDWNNDGIFNQLDIVAALQTGNYLQGPCASLAKSARDADVDAVFDEVGPQQLIRPI